MVDFCLATQEISRLKNEIMDESKQFRKSVNSCKELIEQELNHAGIECFAYTHEGKQEFVRMRKTKNFGKVVETDIFSCLKKADLTDILNADGETVDERIANFIESQLPCKVKTTVFISETPPRKFQQPKLQEESESKLQELAFLMQQETSKLSKLQSGLKEKKLKFEVQKKQAEAIVSEHLKEYDPVRQFRRIKLHQGGEEQTYFLRRKEKNTEKSISYSKLLKLLKSNLLKLCDEHGISSTCNSTNEMRKILQDDFLEKLEKNVLENSARLKKTVTVADVTINKFAPRN